MFCVKCGKPIGDDAIFCKYCGHKKDDIVRHEVEQASATKERQPVSRISDSRSSEATTQRGDASQFSPNPPNRTSQTYTVVSRDDSRREINSPLPFLNTYIQKIISIIFIILLFFPVLVNKAATSKGIHDIRTIVSLANIDFDPTVKARAFELWKFFPFSDNINYFYAAHKIELLLFGVFLFVAIAVMSFYAIRAITSNVWDAYLFCDKAAFAAIASGIIAIIGVVFINVLCKDFNSYINFEIGGEKEYIDISELFNLIGLSEYAPSELLSFHVPGVGIALLILGVTAKFVLKHFSEETYYMINPEAIHSSHTTSSNVPHTAYNNHVWHCRFCDSENPGMKLFCSKCNKRREE